jgi:sugar phosphate isomerase/epimerase
LPPTIHLGVNLNFAKYVYGPKRAIDVAKDIFGVDVVEAVPDNDFGPMLYQSEPQAFRRYHREVAAHARDRGVRVASVLTVYRDTGAIVHPDEAVRESAYRVGLAMLEMAACYGARYASSSLFTMNRELAEDAERFRTLAAAGLAIWKRWLEDARRLGIETMLIEMAATRREGFSTLPDGRETLAFFDAWRRARPDQAADVGICYDTGHGISEEESPDPRDRDFRAWFDAFPERIHEIHLKDTDPLFLETFHFGSGDGTIDPRALLCAIRERLRVPEVYLYLEVPGKRGRDIGERRAIEGHVRSLTLLRAAIAEAGYREAGGAWRPE